MRAAREAARVSLEQASEELRIEPKYLAALEEERYDAIGIPVFAKGYLKLYCEYLGLDYARLLPLYEQKAAKTPPPLKGRHSIERRETSNVGMWLAVGIAVVVLVLFVLWLLQGQGLPATGTSDTALAPEPARSASLGSGSAPPEALAPESEAPKAPEPEAPKSEESATSPPLGQDAAPSAPTASASPASVSTAAPSVGPSASAAEGASGPAGSGDAQLDVDLKFSQDSWVEITDAKSTRLYYGLGRAGDESHVAGAPPLTVLIGNADGVVLEVEGKPYAYPRRRNGNVAYFTLKSPRE